MQKQKKVGAQLRPFVAWIGRVVTDPRFKRARVTFRKDAFELAPLPSRAPPLEAATRSLHFY